MSCPVHCWLSGPGLSACWWCCWQAVLLQGCSAVKLAYNNAPELAYWWIDGYADLDDAQSLKVREELARLQQWHRTNELPRIAELLQRTRQLALADTTPEQVCTLFARSASASMRSWPRRRRPPSRWR
jgi:hypothetical protein